ncbi:MAG: pyruvate formate lyase-activating protein, partial [Chloroflexi bacterium]
MRILAVDVGTGTQDILLFDTERGVENCFRMVMPSPTVHVAELVREATAAGDDILLTGVTMGGGPCHWAVNDHLKAGHRVFATPYAARTFNDVLEEVEAMGVTVVSEDEAAGLRRVRRIEMRDFYLDAIRTALRTFGVSPEVDAYAVAVFDHG